MAAPPSGPTLLQHCCSDTFNDVPLHFQIVQLEQQLYAWVGAGTPRLGNLCMAVPTRMVRPLAWPGEAVAAS